MLQITNVKKKYKIGDYEQHALNDVSLNLRDSEFVAILGPSGSGKTTLLNIIGGLDRYDSGDLIINNISTKKYKDKDWDSYRNHTIGFVFQSYNLISHQSVLTNVELALTISGISKSKRRKMAKEALKQVGLENHMNKKPNQMSGGQMQRVAIARALVNNPDILLADEPTGALDSETSVSIMELLKEVAKDRLVVMVTHNPELAQQYATRIVNLKDGKIIDDNDPFVPRNEKAIIEHKNMGKSSMSFLTSLSLSFNNLKTKKGRTILTAFAGSIGIIGIALILALSSGVNTYIADIQKETMTSYPITISESTFDMSSVMGDKTSGLPPMAGDKLNKNNNDRDSIYIDSAMLKMEQAIQSSIVENDLTHFKKYLDDPQSEIAQYLGENGVVYGYNVKFDVYTTDKDENIVNTNDDPEQEENDFEMPKSPFEMMMNMSDSGEGAKNFSELMAGANGKGISEVITDSYDLLEGSLANDYNEVLLVLDSNNEISIATLFQLGLITQDEYDEIKEKVENEEDVDNIKIDYKDVIGHTFSLVPYCDYYSENENGTFSKIDTENDGLDSILENALELKIVGVIKPIDGANNASIATNVAYTTALTDYIINYTNENAVVLAQENDDKNNILTGVTFEELDEQGKIDATKDYLANLSVEEKASVYTIIMSLASSQNNEQDQTAPQTMPQTMPQMPSQQNLTNEEIMANGLDSWLSNNPEEETLLRIYKQYLGESSYKNNLSDFGKVSYDAPSSISIYTDSFEDKEAVSTCIEDYNSTVENDDEKITYTDYVALLTSSITSIVDVISYVLIAFISVSLVVSCIMIGIITHISVMERTKEIGILRAIGASKRNISQVFNAETLIIGLCAGAIGVGVSALLTLPINAVIHALLGDSSVNAVLPLQSAIVLIIISVVITVIAGLLPAKKAAKKDPVIALRSE